MTNAPGADAYPITASTFVLMPKAPKNKANSDAMLTGEPNPSTNVPLLIQRLREIAKERQTEAEKSRQKEG